MIGQSLLHQYCSEGLDFLCANSTRLMLLLPTLAKVRKCSGLHSHRPLTCQFDARVFVLK